MLVVIVVLQAAIQKVKLRCITASVT